MTIRFPSAKMTHYGFSSVPCQACRHQGLFARHQGRALAPRPAEYNRDSATEGSPTSNSFGGSGGTPSRRRQTLTSDFKVCPGPRVTGPLWTLNFGVCAPRNFWENLMVFRGLPRPAGFYYVKDPGKRPGIKFPKSPVRFRTPAEFLK